MHFTANSLVVPSKFVIFHWPFLPSMFSLINCHIRKCFLKPPFLKHNWFSFSVGLCFVWFAYLLLFFDSTFFGSNYGL